MWLKIISIMGFVGAVFWIYTVFSLIQGLKYGIEAENLWTGFLLLFVKMPYLPMIFFVVCFVLFAVGLAAAVLGG